MSKKNYSKWTKSAAASMLAFSLVATPYAISFGDQGANVSQKSASAAVLDIELLSNMTLTNNSGTTASNRFQLNPDGTQNVDFTVSGKSLAQASTITSGKKQVVLGVPEELQGLVQPNGNAQIDSSITLRINQVPLVATVLDATDAVIGAVTKVVSATPGISINIDEVYDKLDALNNIGEAGQGKFTAPLSINADGSVISAPIDDGLGLILAQNLNDALTDLNNAVQALTATGSGPASNIAATALNATLIPLKATVSAAVSTLKTTISLGGAIVNQLADAAVLGDTEIIVPTKVTGPAEYLNTNPTLDAGFVGSVVKGNVITLDLFKSSDGKSTVYYQGNPDDFAVPATPTDVATAGNSTDGYEVTGKAEANSDVTVYDKDGNEVGTGKADADGNFTISVPGSVGPEADLTVTATNANGESDPASTQTPADPVVVPEAPTDVTTTGNSTDGYEVTGKTEPGATVNVYDKDGNEVGTGTADENGDFTISVPGSVGPEADLTVKAENSAGESDGVDTKTPADASTAAPTAPTDVVADGNPVDGYEVTGKTDPNTDVTIYDKDGNEVGSGTSDANGDFTVNVPGSVGPDAELTVTATNDNGSSSSNVTTPLVSGAITVNPMTQYESIITGTAPKGTVKVKLIVNGRDLNTATVAADGTYSFDKKYVYDADGNKKLLGEGDEIQVVYYGPGKTSNVTPGNTVVGAKEYLVTLDNVVVKPGTAATISGTAGPEIQKVRLSVNGVDLVDGTVNADGTYSFSTKYVYTDATKTERKLIGAGDVVKVTAVDDDKPKTTIFAEKVVEEAGATPVEIISINKETFTISGTTDKDVTKVQLVVNGKALGTYAVTDGAFSIERKYVYEADGTTKKILGAGDEVMIRNAQTSIEGSATQVVQ